MDIELQKISIGYKGQKSLVRVTLMRKYCLNCGKKFYPKSYYSYPQTEYTWGHDPDLHARHEVPAEHRHFHSLNCMKVWLAKNHEAVTIFLNSVGNSDNNIETNNHN